MKITAIKQQEKRSDRYSIFVDGKYAFSLSETALLESKLASGQELSKEEVKKYKQISADDKLYGQALRYVAMRPRTKWEVEFYLQRKKASPPLVEKILNKLTNVDLINDLIYARAFVKDRQLLRPTSRRKLVAELRKKRVASEIIDKVVSQNDISDQAALREVIKSKRRQTKYQEDLKLMQYLARQGFSYEDVKSTLAEED